MVWSRLLADEALNLLNDDKQGFDAMDRGYCWPSGSICWWPGGSNALAASISEERVREDVLEPYLIQQGYLMRTPVVRVATAKTYLHFGLPVPESGDPAQGGFEGLKTL